MSGNSNHFFGAVSDTTCAMAIFSHMMYSLQTLAWNELQH